MLQTLGSSVTTQFYAIVLLSLIYASRLPPHPLERPEGDGAPVPYSLPAATKVNVEGITVR
jgi:hypothetical protein